MTVIETGISRLTRGRARYLSPVPGSSITDVLTAIPEGVPLLLGRAAKLEGLNSVPKGLKGVSFYLPHSHHSGAPESAIKSGDIFLPEDGVQSWFTPQIRARGFQESPSHASCLSRVNAFAVKMPGLGKLIMDGKPTTELPVIEKALENGTAVNRLTYKASDGSLKAEPVSRLTPEEKIDAIDWGHTTYVVSSANGTSVNGSRLGLGELAVITPGDVIGFTPTHSSKPGRGIVSISLMDGKIKESTLCADKVINTMCPTDLTMHRAGFTLSELLIALIILGVIATFTIPKVLSSQQQAQKKALAKEYAASISEAYQRYKNDHSGDVSNMYAKDLAPYFNYVKLVTDWTNIDNNPGNGAVICDVSAPCLKFASGAMSYLDGTMRFNGTANTDALLFHFDPDGQYSGLTQGVGKGIVFVLYYNGRITSYEHLATGTFLQVFGVQTASPGSDPSWFSW